MTISGRSQQTGGRWAGSGASGGGFTRTSDADLQAIIVDGDAERLVKEADRLGRLLKQDQLTTSQIRGIFGVVRKIEQRWPQSAGAPTPPEQEQVRQAQRELLLLKPKLAYQARRASGRGVENLRQVLEPAIDLVGSDRQRFQRFADFFEAILAYHRFHGGQ